MDNEDIIDAEIVGEPESEPQALPAPDSQKVPKHGGARPGAGRKPKGWTPPPTKMSFDEAKARNETAKAILAEIEVRLRVGQFVNRETVRDTVATAMAALAQRLRSLPDLIERRHSLPPAVIEQIAVEVDSALSAASTEIAVLLGTTEGEDGA